MIVTDVHVAAPMDHHEKMRLRAAAFRVTRLHPGVVGEVLARELLSFENFGWRLGTGGSIMRLADHVLKAPLPVTSDA